MWDSEMHSWKIKLVFFQHIVKQPFKQVPNLIFLIFLKIFISQTAHQTLGLEKLF